MLCIPSANCAEKIVNRKAATMHYNNEVDHRKNENAVAVIGRLNFPVVNKSVIAKIRKVKMELAASL